MEKRKYGYRWIIVETVFSTIKRMFDEYISATRFQIGKRNDVEDIFVQPIHKNGIREMEIS